MKKDDSSVVAGLLAALLYGVVSGSMSFMNKTLLSSYDYHYPDVIMLLQVTVTSITLTFGRIIGICNVPAWTIEGSREFLVSSLCFALHTTLALAALQDLSIPIYNVLRRMLPLMSLLMAVFILGQHPSRNIVASVILMAAGTLVTGVSDLRFTFLGYSEAIASVVAQSVYLTYVQKRGLEKGSSALYVTYMNSVNCIPILFVYTLFSGHLQASFKFTGFTSGQFVVVFVGNTLLGCVFNYTLFLCTSMTSALTTSIVGVIKGVLTTTIGFFTFGGVPLTVSTVCGVVLNAVGGAVYVMVKYFEKIKSREALLPSTVSDGKATI